MMTRCICVPKDKGEEVRDRLISQGLFDRSVKITQDGDSILIPILSDVFEGYDAMDADLEQAEKREKDYRKIVNVPDHLRDMLPSAFDTVGDIIIVRIPDELMPFAPAVGDALLRTFGVRTVMADGGVKGELRRREMSAIAGEDNSETVYREFGVSMAVDMRKAYFNPRASSERMRVASLVKDGEIIIDMFAGVAPFPLVIAKHRNPSRIYAIDLNEDATELVRRNIKMNKLGNIIPICGDASAAIKELPQADRIIMNLPMSADSFLSDALANLRPDGMIHLYKLTDRATHQETIAEIAENARNDGYNVRIDRTAELRTYSASMSVYAIDIVKQ